MSTNDRAQTEPTSNGGLIGLALAASLCALGAGVLLVLDSTSIDAQAELATVGAASSDVTGSLLYVDALTAAPGSIKIQAVGNDPTPDADTFQHLVVTLTNEEPGAFFDGEPADSLASSSSPSSATSPAPWMEGNSLVLSGQFDYVDGGDKWICLSVNSTVLECQQITLAPVEPRTDRLILDDFDGDMRFTHADRPFTRETNDDSCPLEFGANETGCATEDPPEQVQPLATEIEDVEVDAAPQGAVSQTCNGLAVTVSLGEGEAPTNEADVILGTSGDDLIDALGGDDIICGLEGNDEITGGRGEDVLLGGEGDDVLRGGTGDDVIDGGAGDDEIRGGDGHDEISGSDGQDSIAGGDGHDILRGGTGRDTLSGQGGNDQIVGDQDDAIDSGE